MEDGRWTAVLCPRRVFVTAREGAHTARTSRRWWSTAGWRPLTIAARGLSMGPPGDELTVVTGRCYARRRMGGGRRDKPGDCCHRPPRASDRSAPLGYGRRLAGPGPSGGACRRRREELNPLADPQRRAPLAVCQAQDGLYRSCCEIGNAPGGLPTEGQKGMSMMSITARGAEAQG